MNKTAIKNFAVWARVTLMEAVSQRAFEYEITEKGKNDPNADIIAGRPLTAPEKQQRRKLIQRIAEKGFQNTMEEATYTWFNRFIALRYMEVNGYLPSRVRVFTNEAGEFKPEILKEAMTVELPGLNREEILSLLEKQDNEALYKRLLIAQCNDLSDSLPRMFEKIANWTELLFPGNLLKADSVLGRMVADIPEEDWTDQVQILGWAYQYYISEKHDEIINIYKGTIKKDDIPAATQLFTTDWVVRYMVDNSLGRYWIERHPESTLGEKLEFFVYPKSGKMVYINESVTPQELTFFDPCMGSGHILVYAFDVLMEIYKECGYSERDAAGEIVRNNLYGLDIDDRCSQLAYFAVMMKARSYDRRFLTRGIEPHVLSIQESNRFGCFTHSGFMPDGAQNAVGEYLVELFRDAKEIGSLKTARAADYSAFLSYLAHCGETAAVDMEFSLWNAEERPNMEHLAKQADILARKYAVVCTNPPYMNKLEGNLKVFVTKEFKNFSGDLFSVFIFHNFSFCKEKGYSGFMTPFVWMFIKTYENLRNYILAEKALTTLVQMEYSAFEEATVPICSFVLQNGQSGNKSLCFRLSDFKGGMEVQKEKVLQAIADPNCGYFHEADQANFSKIPGSPVAYWVSEKYKDSFCGSDNIEKIARCRIGVQTGNNDIFCRHWPEVEMDKIYGVGKEGIKWFPYTKGGTCRKWYGNNDLLINWEDHGREIKKYNSFQNVNETLWFKPCITWGLVTSGMTNFRYVLDEWHVVGNGGPVASSENMDMYLLSLLNSIIGEFTCDLLNPTINLSTGIVGKIPVLFEQSQKVAIEDTTIENICLSKADWDSYEISWDFKRNPLV